MKFDKEKELTECESFSSHNTVSVVPCHTMYDNVSQDNDTTLAVDCQAIDKELESKWIPKKEKNLELVDSYERLGFLRRSERVANCGTFLEFGKSVSGVGEGAPAGTPFGSLPGVPTASAFKLHNANFCRDRLCPMCSWRRSYKIFGQVSQIMDLIANDYEFLFLTLTVPNVTAQQLSETITRLNTAWGKLIKYKRVKSVLKGFFKALEVTYNKVADTFHPHLHCVLAVPKKYFKDFYIPRDEWLQLWQRAYKDESITQVDIRKAKSKSKDLKGIGDGTLDGLTAVKALSSAIAEIAKYAVKSSDYLFEDRALTDYVVSVLADSLANRRLCAFGGCFEDARLKLQLDDAEDGDLIHIDKELRSDVAIQIYRYGWSCGVYKLLEVRNANEVK